MQVVASLRASDSDREQVAERLRDAMAEGRLSGDELEQRLEALYGARTYGELDALLADLPVTRSPARRRIRLGRLIGAVSAVTLVVAMLGVLAIMRARSAVGVVGTGPLPRRLNFPGPLAGMRHPQRLNFPGPLVGPHQGLITAASLGVVLVVLLTAAAVVWALIGSSSQRQP